MFDCGVVLHLKLGNPQGTDPVSHRKGVCRLHWMLIPGLLVVYTNMDLPNRPGISQRAAAARTQTAGVGWSIVVALVRSKTSGDSAGQQATSGKLDNLSRI